MSLFKPMLDYHCLFLDTIWVSTVRILDVLILVGYGYLTIFLFSIAFGSILHGGTFIPR